MAAKANIVPEVLAETVKNYNQHAGRGNDPEFGKGKNAYGHFLGDLGATHPNVAPLDQAPFYAIWMYAGDIGNFAGIKTDENARVIQEDGRVVSGLLADNLHGVARDIHDARGRVITPGLIDPHTHVVHAGARWEEFSYRMDPDRQNPPEQTGLMWTVKQTRSAQSSDLLEQSLIRVRALVAEGVTTLESKTGYGLDVETEHKMAQVSRQIGRMLPVTVVSTFLGAHAVGPEYSDQSDDYIDFLCEDVLPLLVKEDLVDAVDIFCDARGFNHPQVRRLHTAADTYELDFYLHADQYTDFGAGRLAAELGARAAAHLEHANSDTALAMARAGTVAVLLPGVSWTYKMDAVPPVKAFRRDGVPMALATNCNPGSSVSTSPLSIMNMACHLFGFSVQEALAGFTRCAAQALGMHEDRGTLEPGKWADLAVWNVSHPGELPAQIGGGRCHAVIKAGELVHINQVPCLPTLP